MAQMFTTQIAPIEDSMEDYELDVRRSRNYEV
jgi:hypothetical protein